MSQSPEAFVEKLSGRTNSEVRRIYLTIKNNLSGGDTHSKIREMEKVFPYLIEFTKEEVAVPSELVPPPKSLPVFENSFSQDVAYKYVQLCDSAKRRGKDFNLTLKDVAIILKTEKCYYTGVTMNKVAGDNFQRTVDRVDNKLGYIRGNVVACTHLANKIKNELFESPTSSLKCNINFMTRLIIKLKGL